MTSGTDTHGRAAELSVARRRRGRTPAAGEHSVNQAERRLG